MGKFPYPKEGHRYETDWGLRMRRKGSLNCEPQDAEVRVEKIPEDILGLQSVTFCRPSHPGHDVCVYTWGAMSLKDSSAGLEHPEWARRQILLFLSDPGPRGMMVDQQLWAHQWLSSSKSFTWMARDHIRRWGQQIPVVKSASSIGVSVGLGWIWWWNLGEKNIEWLYSVWPEQTDDQTVDGKRVADDCLAHL